MVTDAGAACSLTVDTENLEDQSTTIAAPADATTSDGAANANDATTASDAALADDTSTGSTNDDDASVFDADADADAAPADYVHLVLAANPLAYYRFEETSSVVAVSQVNPDRYDGEYTGEITQGGAGALGPDGGRSVRFNGATSNDFGSVVVANAFAFPNNAPFTFELWFRALLVDSDYRGIFSHGPIAGSYAVFLRDGPTSPNYLFFTSQTSGGSTYLNSSVLFPVDQWSYLVVTFDGQVMIIYRNGSPVAAGTFDVNGGIDAGTDGGVGNFYIGSSASTYNELLGDVDELAVYDYVLLQDTISAHYAAALAQMPPDAGIADAAAPDAADAATSDAH